MAKPDEYTADIDDLEEIDDDLDHEDLDHEDLDDEVLEEDLDDDLTAGLGEVLEDDLDEDLSPGLDDALGTGTLEEEEEDETAELDEDEDEDEEAALDVLLLARDTGLNDDLARLDDESRESLGNSDAPIGAGEFTCRSCFLVKRRPQLADEERMVCLDCV